MISATTDADVVTRCAAGDEAALAELYDALGGTAYSLALWITGDAEAAAAVVERAFAAAWRGAPAFDRDRSTVVAWLLGLVHREATGAARQVGRPAAAPAPGRAAALAELPDEERRVLELAYLGGHSRHQIAGLLGEPPDRVAALAHSALRRFAAGRER